MRIDQDIRIAEAEAWAWQGDTAADAVAGEDDYSRGQRDAYRDTAEVQRGWARQQRGR